jgi:hypothetical protein
MLKKRQTSIIQVTEQRFLFSHDGPGILSKMYFPSSPYLSRGEEFFLTSVSPAFLHRKSGDVAPQSVQHILCRLVDQGIIKR